MPELTLDDNHIYRLDGAVLPSVTQVIKAAGMMGWLPSDEYYRQRGQYVHEAIRMYFKGTLDIDALSEGVRPYVDSAIEYITVTGYKPTHVEISLNDTLYGYAGKPDAVPLLDWKNGGKSAWQGIQLSAYDHLCRMNKIISCGEAPITVHLRPDGKLPKVEPYKLDRLRNDFKIFVSALALYQWRKNNKLLKEE